jgi:hypothetical protein
MGGWNFHHPQAHLLSEYAVSSAPEIISDVQLITRITGAYKKAIETDLGSNFWVEIFGPMKKPIHDSICSNDRSLLTDQLREPHTNMLFHGFEILNSEMPLSDDWRKVYSSMIYDVLLALCEAVGAIRLDHPECYQSNQEGPPSIDVETLLIKLDDVFGFHVDFQNPYPNEPGLATSRGVAGYRAIQSLYQGYRIAKLAGKEGRPVVEIGGGLGRTCYYSTRFGIRDYTIVDIPMSSVAQAYFLGRCLGEHAISLYGENTVAGIMLIPPDRYFSDDRSFGLLVNIDGFPEFQDAMVSRYLASASRRTGRFLSINHETLSPRTVRQIASERGWRSVFRYPYWMRRGYVEELFLCD